MPAVDFQRSVLERSHAIPVLVDFWAPWCGPCRTLGPTLEALAVQTRGRWELVAVNVDEQPELAADQGVAGIPAVKLFDRGQVVAEFVGVLSRDEVERWLATHLPAPGRQRLEALEARWPESGPALGPELEAYTRENPDDEEGRLRLALAVVASDPARARELAAGAEGHDLAADVAGLADLMELGPAPARLAPPFERARAALARHDLDAALARLIEAAGVDRSFGNEVARRAAVALFHALGTDHPLTRKHLRALSMVLHA